MTAINANEEMTGRKKPAQNNGGGARLHTVRQLERCKIKFLASILAGNQTHVKSIKSRRLQITRPPEKLAKEKLETNVAISENA